MMPTLFAAGWADSLLGGLLSFALRATVILCVAWGVARVLHRASAATRHLVWTTAIAGVLALPVLQAYVPAWTVPVLSMSARLDPPEHNMAASPTMPAPVASSTSSIPATQAENPLPASLAPVQTRPGDAGPGVLASVLPRVSVTSVLATVWIVLAALLLLRLAIANARVSSWQRSSRAVEDVYWLALLRRLSRQYGIERPVVLLENEETDVPVTWGVVYPVVLIPAATAEQWDEEQRVAVLTHELAHVKRFDALTQMLAQIAIALLWFHPLVWMAVRRMRQEREHACDDFVLVAGARASRYADDLLGLARRLTRPTAPAAAALAMARRSELEGRLLAILDPETKRSSVRRAKVALLTAGVVALSIPLAAFRPGVRVETPMPPASATPVVAPPAPIISPEPVRGESPLPAVAGNTPINVGSQQLDALSRRLGAMVPSTLSLSAGTPLLVRIRADTEPRVVDVETLIDVTRAAKRMTSDHEKGELLALIAKRYQRSDALRDAYLEAVFTLTSDHERSQALLALLDRDSLPTSAIAQVLRSTAMMTSDVNKGMVLKRISPAVFADSLVQRAYLEAIAAMTSDVERGAALKALIKQRPLARAVQLALVQATVVMTSDVEKANTLLLFLDNQGIADETIRRAFFKAAETLTSDTDYRRIMTAVMK